MDKSEFSLFCKVDNNALSYLYDLFYLFIKFLKILIKLRSKIQNELSKIKTDI